MEERKDRDRCVGCLLCTYPFLACAVCEPGVCLPRAHGLEGGRQVRACLGLCSGVVEAEFGSPRAQGRHLKLVLGAASRGRTREGHPDRRK